VRGTEEAEGFYTAKLMKKLDELRVVRRSGFRAKFTFRISRSKARTADSESEHFQERGAPQGAEPSAFFELIRFGASTVARMFTTVGSAIWAAAS
jgi:hypothetical protein